MFKTYRFSQNLKLVFRNIIANKKRNILTCLGIIMGVASIMAMQALFDVAAVSEGIFYESYGYSNIVINNLSRDYRPKGLTQRDKQELLSIEGAKALAMEINMSGSVTVSYNKRSVNNVGIIARDEVYYENDTSFNLAAGRTLTAVDSATHANVCIIGKKIAKKLFGSNEAALGKEISIGKFRYEVVGVEDVAPYCSDRLYNPNEIVVTIPIDTMTANYGWMPNAFVLYTSGDYFETLSVHDQMISYIENEIHLNWWEYDDIFFGNELTEYIEKQHEQGKQQTLIAGICLLVGGIGIMNMMFVSVTERTREIGLRKALGATPKRIQAQFIMESMILSLAGGIVGAVLGLALTFIINIGSSILFYDVIKKALPGFLLTVNFKTMFIGLFFSLIVGIIFGWLPARKASRMNPIDALK